MTVSLSGRDYITISILFPFIYNLVNFQLKNINLKIEDVRAVKDELIESLNKRFLYIFQNDIFLASTFLDFRFKKFEFIKNQNERVSYLDKAKRFLNDFNDQISIDQIDTNSNNRVNSTSQLDTQSSKSIDNENFLDSLVDNNFNTEILTDLDQEIDQYSKERPIFDKDLVKKYGPLIFYKNFHLKYPILTKIAKKIFCITATSVPSEGLFSQAGLIQTDLRNRLDQVLLEILTFIKYNF